MESSRAAKEFLKANPQQSSDGEDQYSPADDYPEEIGEEASLEDFMQASALAEGLDRTAADSLGAHARDAHSQQAIKHAPTTGSKMPSLPIFQQLQGNSSDSAASLDEELPLKLPRNWQHVGERD